MIRIAPLAALAISLILALPRANADKPKALVESAAFDSTVQPFFKTYCLRCHNDKVRKGEFRLDNLSRDFTNQSVVHDGIADICCKVLADLAKRGEFGDWSVIDFNVAALLDDVERVQQRDKYVRDLIML